MTDWNYADVWEVVAETQPGAPALFQGGRTISWREFDARADRLASWLLGQSVTRQDKVALYLYNCPEYLEVVFATAKIGLVPVNTNYRYTDQELRYLWDNADAVAVVFHGSFVDRVERVRAQVPRVRSWLWVDDGSGSCPPWAVAYEEAADAGQGGPGMPDRAEGPTHVTAPWSRSGDDLFMLYTGGTTGMPKGVMWRQDDLFARMNAAGFRRFDPHGGLDGVREDLSGNGPGLTLLPACPLMHGTGAFTAFECLSEGGQVVLTAGRSYNAVEVLETIAAKKVNGLVIVGDPFARPLLAALDDEPSRWDLSSLVGITSSGAMWSTEVKRGLLDHHPNMLLVDVFSSSEALGIGKSVASASSAGQTAEFELGPNCKVLGLDGGEVQPGSEEVGVLALGGRNPLGYYKDADKTAATFRVVDGHRYSIPGDFAQVRADGTVHVLGRGSVCINTAGEKVFPEEVEEALKTHQTVRDAVVVGVPHERFGEQVVAVVELDPPGGAGLPEMGDTLIAHVRTQLAAYKAPRHVRVVDTLGRAPNGKVDYRRHREEATAWVSSIAR